MQKFQLELFLHIIGIGSASGLFYNGNSLFIISDNSNVLYEYRFGVKTLSKMPLTENDKTENIPKPEKPDYEAITEKDGDLYMFGSGSTEKRNIILPVNIESKTVKPAIDATDLYYVLQDFGQIDVENFNIEAAVNDGDVWYLFNRGNGPAAKNGIYTLTGDIETLEFQIMFNDIELPMIGEAQTSFTDAVKVNNKLYFLAAAEKTNSTYHDGEVAGSIIGILDIETMEVEMTETISTQNKFEGITVYKEDDTSIEFLLCEDTDSETDGTDIYKLTVNK